MEKYYAKVIVKGSPISKSNFKLFNMNGRAILPYNSGKYHDRYAVYEEQIAYEARSQNPNIVLKESLIAVLRVFYKSKKRHPDTNNITKSIFDGIEKSGLIVNDAQIRRLAIEEFYDEKNPRFELELFCESYYKLNYSVSELEVKNEPILYELPANRKNNLLSKSKTVKQKPKMGSESNNFLKCEICGKSISKSEAIIGNKGKTIICRDCLKNIF